MWSLESLLALQLPIIMPLSSAELWHQLSWPIRMSGTVSPGITQDSPAKIRAQLHARA